MPGTVFDSFALLVYLVGQKGSSVVTARLEQAAEAAAPVLIAAPNWAEVSYMVERKSGPEAWETVRSRLLALPLAVVPADLALAELAGRLKAAHAMSLADCFAAALAIREGADLYTGDPEFRAVAARIRIVWL